MVKLNSAVCASLLRWDKGGPSTPAAAAAMLSSIVEQLSDHVHRLTLRIGAVLLAQYEIQEAYRRHLPPLKIL